MMTINKSNVVLVIVVVAAIAVASVVAVHGHGGGATTALGAAGADSPALAGLSDTSTVASSTGSGANALDPAKQDPTLDQFTSRNPFIQATATPAASGTTTPGPSPSSSSSSSPAPSKPVSADIHLKGGGVNTTYASQKVGAKLPPSSSVLEITSISSSAVTFELLNGYTLGGDTSKKTFPVSQSTAPTQVILENGSKQAVYLITVEQIHFSEGGSSSSGGSTSSTSSGSTSSSTGSTSYAVSHSIRALSIETHNGVPSATIVVDGTTFAAEKVGAVVTTSWGQIKVVGINGPAQTVTILHADVQVTLRVGQSVSK